MAEKTFEDLLAGRRPHELTTSEVQEIIDKMNAMAAEAKKKKRAKKKPAVKKKNKTTKKAKDEFNQLIA